jgi:uncharacterized 2Fe-2S/4Fe-4S cluster protein (DUF4445 family)
VREVVVGRRATVGLAASAAGPALSGED